MQPLAGWLAALALLVGTAQVTPQSTPQAAPVTYEDARERALGEIRGGLAEPSDERALGRFRAAAGHARAAVEIEEEHADGHHLLAMSFGLLAERADGREAMTFASDAFVHATRALELDPEHAGAHHVLGRLHAGAMRMGRMRRLIASRALGGGFLAGASWEDAEWHLAFAEARAPEVADHHWELGMVYWDTGRPALAQEEALHVLELDPRPWEEGTRAKARAFLDPDR